MKAKRVKPVGGFKTAETGFPFDSRNNPQVLKLTVFYQRRFVSTVSRIPRGDPSDPGKHPFYPDPGVDILGPSIAWKTECGSWSKSRNARAVHEGPAYRAGPSIERTILGRNSNETPGDAAPAHTAVTVIDSRGPQRKTIGSRHRAVVLLNQKVTDRGC